MIKSYFKFINEGKYTHKELSDKFWTDLEFDEGVRTKILEIVDDFYETIDTDLEIYDIRLTGSIANYNYHKDSDLDIHILLDFDEYENDVDIFKTMAKLKAFIWNLKHDINIRGADVELYVQDKNEDHIASGLYSMKDGKWLRKPKYTDPDVDDESVNLKYDKWVFEIDKLEEAVDSKDISDEEYRDYFNRAEKLKDKLRKFRKSGLHEGGGEFSVENVTFKKLRNDGHIKRLYDVGTKFYDSIFSQ